MPRNTHWITLKAQGCTAPKRGHTSLAGVLNCPVHSRDEYTRKVAWADRGIATFGPSGVPKMSPRSGKPIHMGQRPKIGHHNYGMKLTDEQVAFFIAHSHEAGEDVHIEDSRIVWGDQHAVGLGTPHCFVAQTDHSVTLTNCTFATETFVYGAGIKINGGRVSSELRAFDGAMVDGVQVISGGVLNVSDGATSVNCVVQRGEIQAHPKGIVIDPRWRMSEADVRVDDGDQMPPFALRIIERENDPSSPAVTVTQPGWVITTRDGAAPAAGASYPKDRTFIAKHWTTRPDVTMERVMATTPDNDNGGGFIAADNDIAFGSYTELRKDRPASLTIDPFGVDYALAVSPN